MDLLRRLFHREEAAASFCSAVIVAGGRASRMEGIDKILCPMGGEPLLLYTLMPFQTSSLVDEIVLVTREDLMVPIGTLCSQRGITKVRRVVKGGESRTCGRPIPRRHSLPFTTAPGRFCPWRCWSRP